MEQRAANKLFKEMAKSLNKFAPFVNASAMSDEPGLTCSPFTNVVWTVGLDVSGTKLYLWQTYVGFDGEPVELHPETPFKLGDVPMEISADRGRQEAAIMWLLWKLGITYMAMLKDSDALEEQGFDFMEILTRATQVKPVVAMAAQGLSADFDQLVRIFDVKAPYQWPRGH